MSTNHPEHHPEHIADAIEAAAAQVNRPFLQIATQVAQLVREKNVAYGDSYAKSGQIMRILYPNGISVKEMDNALAITRVLDKLFRIASGHDGAFGESAWRDIMGYALLGTERTESARDNDAAKKAAIAMQLLEETARDHAKTSFLRKNSDTQPTP